MGCFRTSRWQGAASNAVLSSLGLTAGLFLAGCDDEKACCGAASMSRAASHSATAQVRDGAPRRSAPPSLPTFSDAVRRIVHLDARIREAVRGGAPEHARGELREIHEHLTALPEIVTNAGMPLDLNAVRQSSGILRDAYAGIDATLDGGTGSVPGEEDVTINRELGRFLAVYVTHTGQ